MSRNDPQQGRKRDDRGDMRDDPRRGGRMQDERASTSQLEDEEMDMPERGGTKPGTTPGTKLTGMQDKKGNQPR